LTNDIQFNRDKNTVSSLPNLKVLMDGQTWKKWWNRM
jgi:hypothetical protein